MDYIKAFLIGGALCLIGQILIDKTKLTQNSCKLCGDRCFIRRNWRL